MEKLKKCKSCGGDNLWIIEDKRQLDPKYQVMCECGYKTSRCMTKELAIDEWNGERKGLAFKEHHGRTRFKKKIR